MLRLQLSICGVGCGVQGLGANRVLGSSGPVGFSGSLVFGLQGKTLSLVELKMYMLWASELSNEVNQGLRGLAVRGFVLVPCTQ